MEQHMKAQFAKKMAVLDKCPLCFYNKENMKELVIAESESAYISYPLNKLIVEEQCWIISKEHVTAMNTIEEYIYEEISNYMKSLVQYYKTKKMVPIFIELVVDYENANHTVIFFVSCSTLIVYPWKRI